MGPRPDGRMRCWTEWKDAHSSISKAAEQVLARFRDRCLYLDQLEQDKEVILCYYSDVAPEILDALSSEERCQHYKVLRPKVIVYPDGALEITGAAAQEFVPAKTLPR